MRFAFECRPLGIIRLSPFFFQRLLSFHASGNFENPEDRFFCGYWLLRGLCRCVLSMSRCLTSRGGREIILLPKSLNFQKTKPRTYSFELRVERLELLAKLTCQRKHNRRRCIIRNYATDSRGFYDAADGDDLAATFFPSTATHARTIEAKFSAAASEERTHYLKSRISSASTGCRGLKVSAPTLTVTAASGLSAPIIPACRSFELL